MLASGSGCRGTPSSGRVVWVLLVRRTPSIPAATRDVRASTMASQFTPMNRHVVPHWRDWKLIDIKAHHIRQWTVELARGGDCQRGRNMSPLNPSTVNKILTMMKPCMAGYRASGIGRTVFSRRPRPRAARHRGEGAWS